MNWNNWVQELRVQIFHSQVRFLRTEGRLLFWSLLSFVPSPRNCENFYKKVEFSYSKRYFFCSRFLFRLERGALVTKRFHINGLKPWLLINVFYELTQQSRIIKDKDPSDLLKKTAKMLKCTVDHFQQSPRILKRTCRNETFHSLCLLCGTGLYTNRQIGNLTPGPSLQIELFTPG